MIACGGNGGGGHRHVVIGRVGDGAITVIIIILAVLTVAPLSSPCSLLCVALSSSDALEMVVETGVVYHPHRRIIIDVISCSGDDYHCC